MAWIRGRDAFVQAPPRPNPLWEAIESSVHYARNTKPFEDNDHRRSPGAHYLQSKARPSRFVIADGHKRYDATQVDLSHTAPAGSLGPVETDLYTFAQSSHPTLVVLVGGMGCGKSTTLRYVCEHFLTGHKVVFCNLDACLHAGFSGAPDTPERIVAAQVLVNHLAKKLNELIKPDEEFTRLWSWAIGDCTADHPATHIFSGAQQQLRSALDNDWRNESEQAIGIRKRCREDLSRNVFDDLTYHAAQIDYYLSVVCDGDRSQFIIIIDNVDPLPPSIQFQILDLASRVQTSARCKVVVALRPLTYSSNLQGAHRTIEVIEHIGPSVIDLIVYRVRSRILDVNLPQVAVKVRDGNRERSLDQRDAKRWIEEVTQTLMRESRQPAHLGEPSARTFIEGICGNSLRSALVVAPKVFGASTIPMTDAFDPELVRHRSGVRDHDVIRAVLDGWQGYFVAHPGRVTDNIFDLGDAVPSRSCTSKIRLLKRIASATNKIVTLAEARKHLSAFGYDDQLILDTVNAVIAQSKRLAWSDSVAHYASLDGFQNTKLQVSRAGQFYVDYAIYNLEYVQEVHVDVLLPSSETLQHDPRNFSDRLRSLELFIRYLSARDLDEVKRLLMNDAVDDYNAVYDGTLFSRSIVEALARQIGNIGRALLSGRPSHAASQEINRTIERWESLRITSASSCVEVLQRLKRAA